MAALSSEGLPPYAMQADRSKVRKMPPAPPRRPEGEREIVTDLGLWVAHDQVTVLELRSEGWEVLEGSPRETWRARIRRRLLEFQKRAERRG